MLPLVKVCGRRPPCAPRHHHGAAIRNLHNFGYDAMPDQSPFCASKLASASASRFELTPSPSSQFPMMDGSTILQVLSSALLLLHHGCDKSTRRVKFRFRRRANQFYDSRHPVPEEGALAIVTERWDGMWWTRRHRARDGMAGRDKLRERSEGVRTSGAEAYGKIVWIRRLSGRRQVFRRCESPTGPECQFP